MKNNLQQVLYAILLFLIPHINFGQAPNLRSTSSFALFTAAGAFNNLGPSIITGDVGTDVGALTGFSGPPLGVVNGFIYNEISPESAQAATDVALAYMELVGVPGCSTIGPLLGNGQILLPGVYCITEASTLTGNLILDAQNNPNALFIFQIDGAFATSTFASVSLINSAAPCNVYWQVNGAFALGDFSVFRGTLIASGAISLLEGSSLLGRALTTAGAISTHNITVASCAGCTTPPFVVITETNLEVCGTTAATFNYTVENGPTTLFTSNGTGVLSLSSLPNGTATFTYTPSAAEATNGAVVTITATIADPDGAGPCVASTDNTTLTIRVPANAGTASTPAMVCDNSTIPIDLFSLLTGEQAGGVWTRITGVGGSFDANAGTFTPAPGATSSTFTYTVTGTAPCPNDAETVTVNITPQANAGTASTPATVCDNSTIPIDLFSLLTGEQAGGVWTRITGVGGSFNANAGTFTPAPGATSSTFTYTVTGTAPCSNDAETVSINITPQASAGTSGSTTVCNNSTNIIILADLLTGEANNGTWTLQNGAPNPGNNFNAANGTLDVNGLSAGTYHFVYTITNAAPCTNEEAVITVIIYEAVLIDAGNNQTICATKQVNLLINEASISGGATMGTWSTSGDGIFTGGTAFGSAMAYIPGMNDKQNGIVTLTLTSTDPNGPCVAVFDTIIITIQKVDCGGFPWNGN
jgi:hypothetical protein